MKIKKITINGLHNAGTRMYAINDSVTYFIGPNGIGKSTILEAIQLALLGYIPGYGKTNESIMKHASGPVMAVTAEFDNGIVITRSWVRSGQSVSAKESITGYTGKISDLIADIELPIFNFNEFRSMTANKLKEWFISFLPNNASKLDLSNELKSAAIARGIPCDEPLKSAEQFIKTQSIKGVELVKALNAYFKSEQSYVKNQIAKLQGTVESLIRYEDAEGLDESSLQAELASKKSDLEKLVAYEASKQMHDRLVANIESAKKLLPADESIIPALQEEESRLWAEINILQSDNNDIQTAINALIAEKATLPTANATCPYTRQACETASKLASQSKKRAAELDEQIKFKQEEAQDCSPTRVNELSRKAMSIRERISQIESARNSLATMQSQLTEIGESPIDVPLATLKTEISLIEDSLGKVAANKQYERLTSTVTMDKFKLETELELLKEWAKVTDANGLQSVLMDQPFEDLAEDMSKYLTSMFGTRTQAKFNLISKSNSFSFGLIRTNEYIEFDCLSSGERCLFTLALIMCILDRSKTEVRMIIIDDILDHLDTDNASHLFDALKNVQDIQFILAGVKECNDTSVCVKVQ